MIRRRKRRLPACVLLALAAPAIAAGAPRVTNAWARETPPGSTVGAVYLRMEGGTEPDRLLGAASARARSVELHGVQLSAGVSRMRPTGAVNIPAGATVELAPHGLHLMLLGLETPLRAGETLPLILRFERAGAIAIVVEVRTATASNGTSP